MKGLSMTNKTPANVTPIEDLAASRWLVAALAAARSEVQSEPTGEAVERIRARIFGEQVKKDDRLAA